MKVMLYPISTLRHEWREEYQTGNNDVFFWRRKIIYLF